MRKRILKNSKKGLTLPIAIVISIVLVILAAGLILIALSSISTTTVTVNGRQAFMNVKSALEYAESYYKTKVTEYSTIGQLVSTGDDAGKRVEYLVMKESDGVAGVETYYAKADSVNTENDKTYVKVLYTPATGTDYAKLKLTGYSHYSDNFGNKGKIASLSVTFTIGNMNSQNRITAIVAQNNDKTVTTSDRIKLHVKKPADLPWASVSYYIWTYNDAGNAYTNKYKESSGHNSFDYTKNAYTSEGDTFLNNLNTTEKVANRVFPNGPWETSGDKKGPPAIMVSQGSGWFEGDYIIKEGRVPYFNIVFAEPGTTLMDNGIYNSQTNEIFHLWYLDPSDKNIYFEFKEGQKKETRGSTYSPDNNTDSGPKHNIVHDKSYYTVYWEGKEWNGTNALEDTVVVYLNNQKTAVYFRDKNDTDTLGKAVQLPAGANQPTISAVSSDGTVTFDSSTMSYIGCGWWVANMNSNKVCNITITYNGTHTVKNARPSSNKEIWIVGDGDNSTAHLSETTALKKLGVALTSYVTVHAKVADYNNAATPTLSYKDVGLNSTIERTNLYEKILEAESITLSDYQDTEALTNAINAGKTLYNTKNLIRTIADENSSMTIQQAKEEADKRYKEKITAIDTAIQNLKPAKASPAQLQSLRTQISRADQIIAAQEANGIYDNDYYTSHFKTAAGETIGEYKTAKEIANLSPESSDVTTATANLKKVVDDIAGDYKLDRQELKSLLDTSKEYTNSDMRAKYDGETWDNFKDAWDEASKYADSSVSGFVKLTTQATINSQKANLQDKYEDMLLTAVTEWDTTALKEAKRVAQLKLRDKINCTDETYNALKNAMSSYSNIETTAASQDDIDNAADDLNEKIAAFTIYKPQNTNDYLDSEGKIRVWVINHSPTTSYMLNDYMTEDAETPTTYADTQMSHYSDSGISYAIDYMEFEKSNVNRISVSITKPAQGADPEQTFTSPMIDMSSVSASDSKVFVIGADYSISLQDLYMIYFAKTDSHGEHSSIKVSVDGQPAQARYESIDTTAGYYVLAYAGTGTTKIKSEAVYTNNDTAPYNEFTVTQGSGQYIAQMDFDTRNITLINVNDIYKKYTAPSGSNVTPTSYWNSSEPTVSNLTANDDYEIRQIDTELTLPALEANQRCIILDARNVSSFNGNLPAIYVWTDEGGLTNFNASPNMTPSNISGIYYHVVDTNKVSGIIIKNQDNDTGKQTTNIEDINRSKRYYLITATNDLSNYGKQEYGLISDFSGQNGFPTVEATSDPEPDTPTPGTPSPLTPDTEMEDDDPAKQTVTVFDATVNMVYVGGNKKRIVNQPYAEIFGDGKKENDTGWKLNNSNYKFGGDGGKENNNDSGFRVGSSKLKNYIDWYAYKLPVEQSEMYTFTLKGMNPNSSSTETLQVKGAYGDVWIEQLDNTTKTDGKYSNINCLTFDPETKQIGSTLTVYFKMPQYWSDLSITAYGPTGVFTSGTIANRLSRTYDGNTYNKDIYYWNGVSKNTPFIIFKVKARTSASDAGEWKEFRTSLQGGDSVLFNPTLNSGYGGWSTFVSDQENLKREVQELISMYYGSVVVGNYNDKGEIASGYNLSDKIKDAFNAYATNNSGTYYSVDESKTNISDTAAYAAYRKCKFYVDNYTNLYNLMSTARAYIANPLKNSDMHSDVKIHGDGGGYYTEYYTSGMRKQYSTDSVSNIRAALANAELAYLKRNLAFNTNSDGVATSVNENNDISKAITQLKRAIAGMTVTTEGTIAVVLFDAQEKVAQGHTFKLEYKVSPSAPVQSPEITDTNTEGYPIIFIQADNIYNVQMKDIYYDTTANALKEVPLGSTKDIMKKDEAWVLMDIADPDDPNNDISYWTRNSTSDYRQIGSNLIRQDNASDTFYYDMKPEDRAADWNGNWTSPSDSTVFEPMTLYFTNDVTVDLKSGTDYTIKAGVYYFTNEDTNGDTSPVRAIGTKERGRLNIFSEEAHDYFTNPTNYGQYTTNAKTLSELNWYTGNGFKTGINTAMSYNINFESSSGSFDKSLYSKYSYATDQGFSFRWSSADPLYTRTVVKFYADEFHFASVGTIDGATKGTSNSHFYLCSADSSASEMEITFDTDVRVNYIDDKGKVHDFVIHEGRYTIKKDPNRTATAEDNDYIADLYNEQYWKSFQYVIPYGRNSRIAESGIPEPLNSPIYS